MNNLEQIQKEYPILFTESPSPQVSERYSFVSSAAILERMLDLNWDLDRVRQKKSKRDNTRIWGKHEMYFRNPDPRFKFADPREVGKPAYFEVRVSNSYNAKSALLLDIGIFTLVCSNGLIAKTMDFGSTRLVHLDISNLESILDQFAINVDMLRDTIEEYSRHEVDPTVQQHFARLVATARWGENKVDPEKLLTRRRSEDGRNDLWSVLNVIQENAIKAGFSSANRRTLRQTRSMDTINKINTTVWEVADHIYKEL